MRTKTRAIYAGGLKIGAGAPISVQSMTNTDTRDAAATSKQIADLAREGCELVRLAVADQEAAARLNQIVAHAPVPLVADIHF
ncbi:MAG: flavodoxin-dependent (E)-4-hydroxy-3-methylbut-2-enyl-diphosphate synthase, partial [Firmicutes bacterium]|nr:flavodoxin-dependent (E)-4-hydroxy-3-methylbut-2-enyl-diphosphate synthase [Bacillota bacterium]